MDKIMTYNSKHDINGNRLNLVVNHEKKEIFFYGCNAYNIGNIYNNCGIREVRNMRKEFLQEGYKEVSHKDVYETWGIYHN